MPKTHQRTVCFRGREAEELLEWVETAPMSSGRTSLLKYLNGEVLTQNQAIRAKCCDCMGHYIDGKIDCEVRTCPLYPFMPYEKKECLE